MARRESWLESMAECAERQGYWHSSRVSRPRLPGAENMLEESVSKEVVRMWKDGMLRRVAKGCYVPAFMEGDLG